MVRKLKGSTTAKTGPRSTFDRDAHLKRAADHYNANRFDEAIRVYGAMAAHDPQDFMAWYLRGLVENQTEHHDDALESFAHALAYCVEEGLRIELKIWTARSLTAKKQYPEATKLLLEAARHHWNGTSQLYEIIELLMAANSFDVLEPLFARVLELQPDHPQANAEISLFDFRRKDFESAWKHATRALEQNPELPAALRVLGHIHHDTGDVKKGVEYYRRAVDGCLAGKGPINVIAVYESMLGALVYAEVSDEELRTSHENWHRLVAAKPRPRKSIRPRGDRPLRIGYVSPDFRHHAVSFFFEPLLHNHDLSVVTPVLYSNAPAHDDISDRIRAAAPEWRVITDRPDDEVFHLIEKDEIDILVDLAGFTLQNRMGVFHMRPAPLQINYLGYPCTTGLGEMDYRFTDEDCDPLGETDGVYTEKLVRLPGGFYAWRQPDAFPKAGPPPMVKNGFITFGSLNTLSKITDDVIALWSRLMNETPRSRLILQADSLPNPWVRDRILAKFAHHGIAADRLVLHGRMAMLEHLELYNQIDVALDPFPWGGHTTTCMAAFMSVPVVTLRGRRMASRMSASVLHRMGFDAWIAETPEQYIQIAKGLVADVDRLATIRLAQRTVFAASGLMDGHRLARVVEAACQAIWDHHAEG